VLLRAGLSNVELLWRLVNIIWGWRAVSSPVLRRTITLLIFAATHATIFVLAGVFSARIGDSNGEVLIKSNICGFADVRALGVVDITDASLRDFTKTDAGFVGSHQLYSHARDRSRSCYMQALGQDDPDCNGFVQPVLYSKVTLNDSCPFNSKICDTASSTLDTGLLDSNHDLGINSPKKNRIQFRKILSCSLIPAERKYSSNWTLNATLPIFPFQPSEGGPGVAFKYYNLGPQSVLGIDHPSTFWITNYTSANQQSYVTL
jgi:hypothetical protein